MATLEAIQAKIRVLQAKAETLLAKKSSAALKAIHDLMSEHGLTAADIEKHSIQGRVSSKPSSRETAKGSSPAVKYLDPRTGKTWSGHGRAPLWIADAKDRSKFLADGVVKASAPAAKPTSGTARKGPPKGTQPPLYRDPKTGLTWSGRGPAPAWLASTKDRAVFLIDKNVEAGGDTGGKPNATAKKAVVKKSALASETDAAKKLTTKTSKRSVAKKAVAGKTAAKKLTAKKATAKKATAKKATVEKATAEKATAEEGGSAD